MYVVCVCIYVCVYSCELPVTGATIARWTITRVIYEAIQGDCTING